MKKKLRWLSAFTAVALVTSVALAHPSMFCRDCPFPSKVSEGRWIMPNGVIQVEIDERFMPKSMDQVDIFLRDLRTGAVVAKGVAFQHHGSRTLFVDLMDNQSRKIKGFVRYVDKDRDEIQAKFTCEECTIEPMLE